MTRFSISRRSVLVGAASAAVSLAAPGIVGAARAHIVVVGGGFGGAAAARATKARMPGARVTLITDQRRFWICPGSNAVVAGLRTLDSLEVGFDALADYGVDIVYGDARRVDADKRSVMLADGSTLKYDKLIMSPGVAFDYGDIEGLSETDAARVPHAWKAGPQTTLLAEQLAAMPAGGLFVMTMPRAPYRCPPAPAERACLVAHYLTQHNPSAKILILDAKDEFPFQDLFTEAWENLYPGIIEYRSIADDGLVREVDPETLTTYTDFDEIVADVLNVIPAQTAGQIAIDAGVADETGWCPIDIETFRSTLVDDVYVIGDAALADPLPKAGSTAASQATVAVESAIADLTGSTPGAPSWRANCYSQAAPHYGVRLGASYKFKDGHVVRAKTDFSELGSDDATRFSDAEYTEFWLEQVKQEVWG